MILYWMRFSRSWRICSAIAPYSDGSPEVHAGDVLPGGVGSLDQLHDLAQVQPRRVVDFRPRRRMTDDLFRNKRSGVKADRAGFDQLPARHRQQSRVSRARHR